MLLTIPINRPSPHKKNSLVHNVNSAEVDKPWVMGQMQTLSVDFLLQGVSLQETGSTKLEEAESRTVTQEEEFIMDKKRAKGP